MLRVHRISLTDFRGVASREVEFAEHGITLVSGPNEIGKSSLIDALDLLIDFRMSSKHRDVLACQPTGRDVGPRVEVEMTLGPHRLVYRKQWLRGTLTELRIISPEPRQYSGDEAHERFNSLLTENGVDKDLWRKLRVDQTTPLGQASVGGYASVPAMSGGAEALSHVRRGPEEELYQKAKAEHEKYFTERLAKTTGAYKTSREELDAANAAFDEAKRILAEADSDLTEYRRLQREITEGSEELEQASARLRELDEQQISLAEAQIRLRDLDAILSEAEKVAQQESEVSRRGKLLAQSEAEASGKQVELAAAESESAQAEERLRSARGVLDAARTASRLAEADVAWRRDVAEAEQIEAVLTRVEEAQRRLTAAGARLSVCKVTDEVLGEIDAAYRAWEKAHDRLTANAATVAVSKLGDADVLVDGTPATGDEVPLPVLEARTIEVPGTVRVVVKPGSGEKERRTKERETAERYRELCAEAGVVDIAAAREAERDWRAASEEQRDALTALEAVQYDESAEQLRARLEALRSGTAAYEAGRGDRPRPADLAAAQEAELAARSAFEVAEDRGKEAEDAAKRLESRVSTLRTERIGTERTVRNATEELELARKQLSELGTPRTEAELIETHAARDATAERIAALDPERLAEQAANQRVLVPDLQQTQHTRKTRLEVLTDRIARHGESAPEEQLAHAENELKRAQEVYDGLHRKAGAAKLLFETLTAYRDAARDRHTTPFRQRVEHYARRLFSPDVQVQIGPDLTVVSKTVDGVTVPFDSLSAGAREQLSLLARIACADLVGSVPLILDDVLGHADRERLVNLASILHQVADRTQIILLSHEPSRFQIGGIRRVEL